jgi:hypothetical protein
MNHAIHNADFFLNYGQPLSSITDTAMRLIVERGGYAQAATSQEFEEISGG